MTSRTLRVVVVEDDRGFARSIERLLVRRGYEPIVASTAAAAREAVDQCLPDVVFLDIGLPDGSGLDLVEPLRSSASAPSIVMITGRSDLDATVEALERGAIGCLAKPVASADLDAALAQVTVLRTAGPHHRIEVGPAPRSASQVLVAKSAAMRRVFVDIARAARSDVTVLLSGETGVGKEVVARAIHETSGCSGAFVAVSCAALSPALFEAELFGHARGAFTGADRERPGRIEAARDGVLFLDEVGELPLELQAKLLRVLQERTYERVGETPCRTVDARIIAATNRDLSAEVAARRFREDLLHRLMVMPIDIPPLRERAADFRDIVFGIVAQLGHAAGVGSVVVEDAALNVLAGVPWPGNVRQLHNTLRRLLLTSPSHVSEALVTAALASDPTMGSTEPELRRLCDVERRHIAAILEQTQWVKRRAAELLGISRSRLDRKIAEFELEDPRAAIPT